jgi:hypothetical protein
MRRSPTCAATFRSAQAEARPLCAKSKKSAQAAHAPTPPGEELAPPAEPKRVRCARVPHKSGAKRDIVSY